MLDQSGPLAFKELLTLARFSKVLGALELEEAAFVSRFRDLFQTEDSRVPFEISQEGTERGICVAQK